MAATTLGTALIGVDAVPVEVEVDLMRRLPRIAVVGLAANAVRESAERVRSAIDAADCTFPRYRVVINLAPADLKKEGTALDLPIALAILAADDQVPAEATSQLVSAGELSLAGALRPVPGVLSMALLARDLGRTLVVPREVASQAALVSGVDVRAAGTLREVVEHLRGEAPLPCASAVARVPRAPGVDLAEVRGQHVARRAIEIAAAGAHHLLMLGPPGCGKSMLARRLPTVLPAPTEAEILEMTRVHSAAGLAAFGLVSHRPFRAPHHSITVAALVGDRTLRPGELGLAHGGVLFLDEAPEFPRGALETLRTPLEDGVVRIARAGGSVEHPARFQLVLAANPCPCGQRGTAIGCVCPDATVQRYLGRLSGPLLDRVDLHVSLQPVSAAELLLAPPGEPSDAVRLRVEGARTRQLARQGMANGALSPARAEQVAGLRGPARTLLVEAATRHNLSARAATRVVRVARTIADLDGASHVDVPHVAEALGFRGVAAIA